MSLALRPGGPGTTDGEAKAKAAAETVTITLRHPGRDPVTRSLNIGNVPFRERAIVRKATGLPFEAFIADEDGAHVGLDTVQVWWWLACRGENPMVTLDQSLRDWPDRIEADTFDITIEDDEGDHPEA